MKNTINTPIEYMIELDWDKSTLERAIVFLREWDKRNDDFYKQYNKDSKNFDKSEREHYRNCINFWTKRINHEN